MFPTAHLMRATQPPTVAAQLTVPSRLTLLCCFCKADVQGAACPESRRRHGGAPVTFLGCRLACCVWPPGQSSFSMPQSKHPALLCLVLTCFMEGSSSVIHAETVFLSHVWLYRPYLRRPMGLALYRRAHGHVATSPSAWCQSGFSHRLVGPGRWRAALALDGRISICQRSQETRVFISVDGTEPLALEVDGTQGQSEEPSQRWQSSWRPRRATWRALRTFGHGCCGRGLTRLQAAAV